MSETETTEAPVFKAGTRVKDFRDAGLPEHAVYAAAKCGHFVTVESRMSMTEEMLKEYDDAVNEYNSNPTKAKEALDAL